MRLNGECFGLTKIKQGRHLKLDCNFFINSESLVLPKDTILAMYWYKKNQDIDTSVYPTLDIEIDDGIGLR